MVYNRQDFFFIIILSIRERIVDLSILLVGYIMPNICSLNKLYLGYKMPKLKMWAALHWHAEIPNILSP